MKTEKQISQKVTIVGAFFDLLLGIGKIFVGQFYHSQALIVDGVHSLSDLVTDFFVLIVAQYSHEGPDEDHPYGHQRIETLGTLFIGSILFATAGAFFYENLIELIKGPELVKPGNLVLWMALASVIIKEIAYQYTHYWGKKINSRLLMANAWHSRTDAISSIVVLIGAFMTQLGINRVDNIAAIIVALLIGKVGFEFVKTSFSELADTGLEKEKRDKAYEIILATDGVKGAHNFRTRWMGDKMYADVNVEVSPEISVSEGHQIAAWVSKRLIDEMPYIYDVTVHTDVEDDLDNHIHTKNVELTPLRTEVVSTLRDKLTSPEVMDQAQRVLLKYNNENVTISLIFKESDYELQAQKLKQQWQEELSTVSWFEKLEILVEK